MGGAPGSARSWRWLAKSVAGVALAIAAGLASCDRGPAPGGTAAPTAAEKSERLARATATSPDRPLAPSRTLELSRADFPSDGPVRVTLGLAEPSANAEPRPVRLVSQPDHRILQLAGALEADRRAATIEVDPGYLQPGTYLVEMKTTERGVFPLRRYFIIVR